MHVHPIRTGIAVLGLAALALGGTAVPAGAGVNPHDASVTITDSTASVVAGTTTTYTLVVSESGPNSTAGQVAPTFTGTVGNWTCVGAGGAVCSASGSGPIDDPINLPVGGSVTYTVPVTVPSGATGTADVSATFSTLGDTNTANDTATDSDTITVDSDFSITKTDGVTTRAPGQVVGYTIVVANAGPSDGSGTVDDTAPASLTGVSWTCTNVSAGASCPSSGSGSISAAAVSIPAGGSVQFNLTGTVAQGASSPLVNTASVTVATDNNAARNNAATDTDTVAPESDLSITKTDGATGHAPGDTVIYTISATNNGPSNSPSATVTDDVPDELTGVTWTCLSGGGGTCTASGTGDIADPVVLPVGAVVTYTITGTLALDADALSNTATISSAVADGNPANNTATDVDAVSDLSADLGVSKSAPPFVLAGDQMTYLVTVENDGPDPALQVVVSDPLPGGVAFVSIDQLDGPAATITTPAAGNNGTVTATFGQLDEGDSATFSIVVDTSEAFEPGDLIVNVATIESDDDDVSPAATVDPDDSDNSDTAVTEVLAESDLHATKALSGSLVTGTNATYTITVRNDGPDDATGPIVILDELPTGLLFVSAGGSGWTCEADGGDVLCVHDADLANGASSAVTVIARVTSAVGTRLTNIAGVLGAVVDPDLDDNVAEATATVAATATGATGLPRTGSRIDDLMRLASLIGGLGLVAWGTSNLQVLRLTPIRRRHERR